MLLTLIFLASGVAAAHFSSFNRRQADSNTTEDPFASITVSSELKFSPCNPKSDAGQVSSISCARLSAPLDYQNQSPGTVQLAILKLSGTDASSDPVFFNPGGPGDDPIDFVLTKGDVLRAYIGNESDIIAVVPRGVGSTLPAITCDGSDIAAIQRLWEIQSTLPGYNKISLAENYEIGVSLGLDCAATDPDLIPYIGTWSVAHDLDYVRQALGRDKLSYLGHSYGTVLGGTYASLFPDRVGHMVLDGVVDFNDYYIPKKDPAVDIGDADLALSNFFQACHAAGQDNCVIWSRTVKGIRTRFMQADQQILNSPIPVPGYGLLKWPLWRSGVYTALYRPSDGFPLLASVAAEILNGTAGPYITAYMELVLSAATAESTTLVDPKTGLRNSPNAAYFISCGDSGGTSDLTTSALATLFNSYRKVSDFFAGVSLQYPLLCDGANLSVTPRFAQTFQNVTTAGPIVFVGNTADPTTPLRNAQRMSRAFPSSRVLTVNGTGHISFNAAQDPECAASWIRGYFQNSTLPPLGTVCQGNQMPFEQE